MRDFLIAHYLQNYVYMRMCAFFEALFEQAAETIRNDLANCPLDDLPQEFWRKMTQGQTVQSVNPFWQKFYHKVVENAKAKFVAAKVFLGLSFALNLANSSDSNIPSR